VTARRNAEAGVTSPMPAGRPMTIPWHRRILELFARAPIAESVTTRVHIDTEPDLVWRRILFYEDVPRGAPFPLRVVLPCPLRTDGDKTTTGSRVYCVYSRGDVIKRISVVEPARLLQFDVVEQNLGIEGCVLAKSGSYRLFPCGEGTDVALVTNYLAYLHPRCLWRPVEAFLARQLHRHILQAVRATLDLRGASVRVDLAPSHRPELDSRGGHAWTTSPSRSRR